MRYRRGRMRIYGPRSPLWICVGANAWWFGIVASWRKKPIFDLQIGSVINDISGLAR